jgi:hypothetical protein
MLIWKQTAKRSPYQYSCNKAPEYNYGCKSSIHRMFVTVIDTVFRNDPAGRRSPEWPR